MERIPLFVQDGYIICFEAVPEEQPIKEYFRGVIGYTAKECRGLEKFAWFQAHVTAWKDGKQLAETWLGACAYKTVEEFYTTDKGSYFSDMVREVIDQARAEEARS